MKTPTTLLLSIILVVLSNVATAAVLTVSNWTNIPAQYSDISAAIAVANPGDTLYIHGSPNTYPSSTLNKSLTLIGPGYFPTNQNNLPALVSTITISSTTQGAIDSIRLIGLSGTVQTGSTATISNLIISRCYLNSFNSNYTSGQASSVTIQESIVTGTINLRGYGSALVRNCLFTASSGVTSSGGTNLNAIVTNCTFNGTSAYPFSITNTIFSNNIFVNSTIGNSTLLNCTFSNNLTFNTNNNTLTFPSTTPSGTLVNQNPLFVQNFHAPQTHFSLCLTTLESELIALLAAFSSLNLANSVYSSLNLVR
jgi:hypothetical protein